MKKTLLSLVLFSVFTIKTDQVWAQQDPYTTHYAFNRMLYNPAVAGSKNRYCLTALSHYQYTGYEDRTPEFWPSDGNNPTSPPGNAVKSVGPKTQMFSFSAPITKFGGLGIGFINDKLGYERSTHIKIDAAGRIPLGQDAELAVGIEANFLQKGLDGSKLKPLAQGDPSIPTTNVSARHTIFGGGLYYTNGMSNSNNLRDLWVGVSSLNLNHPTYVYSNPNPLGGGNNIAFSTPKTHTYIMGGVTMLNFLGNSNLKFHPSAMIKQNTVWQLDATALVEYQEKLWGGLAYRTTSDALSIMLGYSGFKGAFRGLRIGYSYDLTMSKILSVSSGTHEIQLNYCFEVKIVKPEPVIIVTPPFMHRESD
jgi:type IX secretion system PorP/SprF family membrane protein